MKSKIFGIIGGTGQMGQWLKEYLSSKGHDVRIAGRNTDLTYENLVRQSQIVVLSVPQQAAIQLSHRIGPLMNPEQLLMDVCSMKEEIVSAMLRSTSAQVLGTHPLFGPMTASIVGQNIIFCRGRGTRRAAWLEEELTSSGAVISHITPETHDRHMAVVQGLTHLISICMGRTLQKLEMKPDQALLYATPIFRVKMDLVGRLLAQDLGLYRNLIGQNRHVKAAIDTFVASLEEACRQLLPDQAEEDRGTEYLADIKRFFGDFCREGYRESNLFIESLYDKNK